MNTNAPESDNPKIGELLVSLEIVDETEVSKCLKVADQTSKPVGHALLERFLLSDSDLQRVLTLQASMRASGMSIDELLESVCFMKKLSISLGEAQVKNQSKARQKSHSVKLEHLLILSELVSKQHVARALQLSLVRGCPIGWILCEKGVISKTIFDLATGLQNDINHGNLKIQDAVEVLARLKPCSSLFPNAAVPLVAV